MKRIFAVVFVLIVLAAFTPLGCFADGEPIGLTCSYLTTHNGQLAEGQYKLAEENCAYRESITLTGDVTLDLNGNKLFSSFGITDSSSSSLTITDNSDGKTGVLKALSILVQGSLEVSGGTVTAGFIHAGRNTTISGGSTVTSTGGDGFYIIGDIIISGENTQVTVEETDTGIFAHGSITIDGGTVTATSISTSDDNESTITISGGTVSGGNQIGCDRYSGKCSVNITGNAVVKNTELISGAAVKIEGSANLTTGIGSIFGSTSVTISGGTVTAAGSILSNGTVAISGGTVTAEISGGTVAISGEGTKVTAAGDGYGIMGTIVDISGGEVTATATDGGGHAIEGRYIVTISGGEVTANGSVADSAIFTGGTVPPGMEDNSGISINGGTVTAYNQLYASFGCITISGGTVSGGNQIGCDQSSGKCSVNITGNAVVQNTDLISGAAVNIEGNAKLTEGIGSIFGRNSVVITGGTVNVTGSNSVIYTTDNGAGIRGGIVSGGSITISGAQTQVTAQVLSTAHDDMIGIYAAGNIDIQSGTVTANGNYIYGIHSEGGVIEIKGGEVTAKGYATGILGNVIIGGGSVTAIGTHYGILSDEFTIYAGDVKAAGGNTGINCSKSLVGGDYGVITINGGEVEATGWNYGIQGEIVTINEGTVIAEAKSSDFGVSAAIKGSISVTISGGDVTATVGWYGIEVENNGVITISGGEVTVTSDNYAISGKLVIENGVTSLTATGGLYALNGSVKNAVSGIGWSNTAGTGNGTIIDPSESGRDLSQYRMVQFPLPGVKETPAPNNLTYNGSPQALVTAGTAVGGTMQYAPGTATEPTGGWSESIPTGTDARSYTVWYKVKGPGENNESGTSSVSVTIAPKSITGAEVTLDPAQLTYDGTEQSVSVTGVTIDGLSLNKGVDYIITGNTGTNADGYTAKITGKGNFTGTAEAKWSIGPKSITGATVTLDKTQLTYNGSEQSVGVTGVTIDGLSLKEGVDYIITGNTGTNAGEYEVTVSGKGNFMGTATAKWSIGPKTIAGAEVTLDKTQLTYNGSEQSVSVTKIDGLSVNEGADFTVTGNTGTNAGGYTATVTGQGNFTGTAEAAWSIAPKAMTVSAESVTVPYDGQPHGITVTVTDPSAGAKVTYGKAEDTYDLDESPVITNVSESPLTVYYQVTAANYTDYTGSAVVTITAADDLKSKPIQNELTSVPPELAEFYSDLSELQNALMAKLAVKGEPAQIGQTAFYDVILLISTDGINWVEATEENFPEGGLWVLLKYPEGTGKDTHDFSVSHMFTVTSERLGTTKGDIEYPDPEKTDEGLNVKLTGLSPVAIAWREINTPEPEPERPGIDFFRLHADCGLPSTGFSALRPTVLPDQPKDLRYEPLRMHLMLPTLDRDIELVTMPREGNSWAAAWLGADAGILEGSALPGEGVSLIAGHNTLNDTDYGPFVLLSTLEVNDTVMVREESGALKLFRVYANELLEPDDMERLSALAGDDALVLLTCENESPSGTYLNRRAVFAR